MQKKLRIGTRSSPLALAQAEEVKARLITAHDDLGADDIELVPMSTKGDRILDRALNLIGGKGLFTEEIEADLLDGSIDLAVHSTKDMPTQLPDGLCMTCFLEREDPRDAFISLSARSIADLPVGATVGTASLRRQAQLKRMRPDLKTVVFRGNVQTRLKKLAEREVDATFLAVAGLNRLSLQDKITDAVAMSDLLPAPAQGAIGIECRSQDDRVKNYLAPLNHSNTLWAVMAERAFLKELDGSCRTPIAALAVIDHGMLTLTGRVLSPDGSICHEVVKMGSMRDAEIIGRDAGLQVRSAAGEAFFEALKAHEEGKPA